MEKEFEYEGYTGTVNYDKKCDYYTGEVVIDGKIYTYELLQNAEETLLPDAFSELLTDQNLYITRNKGKLSGITLEGRYSLNWESILTGASKGQYMEVAVPELSGGIISVYGSDPEKKISLLEDYDFLDQGDRLVFIAEGSDDFGGAEVEDGDSFPYREDFTPYL